MVVLKRIIESEDAYLNIQGSNTSLEIWKQVKNNINRTKLIPISSLNINDLVLTNIEHRVSLLYINDSDKTKFLDTVNKIRQEKSGVDTHIELAKQIDHSISKPRDYIPKDDSLFVTNPNNTISFIPSQYMQGIKELRKCILSLLSPQDKIRIDVVDKDNKSLRTLYHLDTNSVTPIMSINFTIKYKRKNYKIKDPKTVKELKDGLREIYSDNPLVIGYIDSFSFKQNFPQAEEAKGVIAKNSILYLSLAQDVDANHKIGILDFSYRNGKINLTMNAYLNGRYCMKDGVLLLA